MRWMRRQRERQERNQRRVTVAAGDALRLWRRRRRAATLALVFSAVMCGILVVVPVSLWWKDNAKPHASAVVTDRTSDSDGTVTWDDGVLHEARIDNLSPNTPRGGTVDVIVGDDPGTVTKVRSGGDAVFLGVYWALLWSFVAVGLGVLVYRPLRKRVALAEGNAERVPVTAQVTHYFEGSKRARGLAIWLDGDAGPRPPDGVVLLEATKATLAEPTRAQLAGHLRKKGVVVVWIGDELCLTRRTVEDGSCAWQPVVGRPKDLADVEAAAIDQDARARHTDAAMVPHTITITP